MSLRFEDMHSLQTNSKSQGNIEPIITKVCDFELPEGFTEENGIIHCTQTSTVYAKSKTKFDDIAYNIDGTLKQGFHLHTKIMLPLDAYPSTDEDVDLIHLFNGKVNGEEVGKPFCLWVRGQLRSNHVYTQNIISLDGSHSRLTHNETDLYIGADGRTFWNNKWISYDFYYFEMNADGVHSNGIYLIAIDGIRNYNHFDYRYTIDRSNASDATDLVIELPQQLGKREYYIDGNDTYIEIDNQKVWEAMK